MAKTNAYHVPHTTKSLHSLSRWKFWSFLALSFLLLLQSAFLSGPTNDFWDLFALRATDNSSETHDFSWHSIVPSQDLRYKPCFGSFDCARLDVPLDWNATSKDTGPRASVAVIKLPSKVPVTEKSYGGTILINPGGPGESGIHMVLTNAKHIQAIVDSSKDGGKYFDIVSFDPRGVNNTTPLLKCFSNVIAQRAYSARLLDYGLLWSSPSVLGLEWGNAQALGESCSRVDPTTGIDVIRYVNTAQTVQDMVEIIERVGEWREAEANRAMASTPSLSSVHTKEVQERTKWIRGGEKIQYWGFSYGTLLGQTFAAMHPNRISRMVLDGVMNARDYYAGTWLTNLHDTDKIISSFCEYCYQAGPERCPLYTGTSGKDIEIRFEEVMMRLKEEPVPVLDGGESGPGVVTYQNMHLHMLTAMYIPLAKAQDFFRLLAGVATRNATVLKELTAITPTAIDVSKECSNEGPFSEACVHQTYVAGMGNMQAIACMDMASNRASKLSKAEFKEYLFLLEEQSKWVSPSWARNRLACVGYESRPAWTFDGPIQGNTSHPILSIGNERETVCPLRNAVEVTRLFPSAAVVQQDTEGHCSFSVPSTCTGRIVREYFQTGKLPSNGTICKPEYRPFIGCVDKREDGACNQLNEDDQQLWESIKAMTDNWP